MEIKGFIDVSFSDWDGKVSSVIFLPNCNLRCPFCYNKSLVIKPEEMQSIPLERIENYLDVNRQWVDGVVITGGEPTLHRDLPILCKKLKDHSFKVKVDTNGTNPRMIAMLIDAKNVDYVALDVKAPLTAEKYSEATGIDIESLLGKIMKTIRLLLDGPIEYEFRSTLVPTLHGIEDITQICQVIKGCRKYALQNLKSEVEMISPKYQNLKPFSETEMRDFQQVARRFVINTIIRA
jgi:pyruvate formate lyase activating enzyme